MWSRPDPICPHLSTSGPHLGQICPHLTTSEGPSPVRTSPKSLGCGRRSRPATTSKKTRPKPHLTTSDHIWPDLGTGGPWGPSGFEGPASPHAYVGSRPPIGQRGTSVVDPGFLALEAPVLLPAERARLDMSLPARTHPVVSPHASRGPDATRHAQSNLMSAHLIPVFFGAHTKMGSGVVGWGGEEDPRQISWVARRGPVLGPSWAPPVWEPKKTGRRSEREERSWRRRASPRTSAGGAPDSLPAKNVSAPALGAPPHPHGRRPQPRGQI